MLDETVHEMRHLFEAGVDGRIPYDEIRERFETVDVTKYGHSMPTWVPDFDEANHLLLSTLGAYLPDGAQVLELGAGTGRVTKMVADAFPAVQITAVDNSANMLTAFADFPADYQERVTAREGDFFSDSLDLPDASFDVMVSVFAVCHGRSEEDYKNLYKRIARWLKPGGLFLCFDHVAAANNILSELAFKDWGMLLEKSFTDEEIHEIIISTIKEDYPLPLGHHLAYLTDAGFKSCDVLWKKNVFAVYSGIKL